MAGSLLDRPGHKHSIPRFIDDQSARDYATLMPAERRRGLWIDPAAGQTTISQWTRRWLPSLNVAERTAENYRRDIRNHTLPRWGDSPA